MSSFVSAFVVEWWLENSFSVHSRHFLGWSVDRSGCTLGRWRTLWRILLPLRAPNLDLTMAKTFTITPLILILVFFDKNKLVLMPLQRILETSLTYAVLLCLWWLRKIERIVKVLKLFSCVILSCESVWFFGLCQTWPPPSFHHLWNACWIKVHAERSVRLPNRTTDWDTKT